VNIASAQYLGWDRELSHSCLPSCSCRWRVVGDARVRSVMPSYPAPLIPFSTTPVQGTINLRLTKTYRSHPQTWSLRIFGMQWNRNPIWWQNELVVNLPGLLHTSYVKRIQDVVISIVYYFLGAWLPLKFQCIFFGHWHFQGRSLTCGRPTQQPVFYWSLVLYYSEWNYNKYLYSMILVSLIGVVTVIATLQGTNYCIPWVSGLGIR